MQHFKRAIPLIIIIIILTLFSLHKTNSNSIMTFANNEEYNIKVLKDTIILYDKEGQEIDNKILNNRIMDCAIGDIDNDDFEELIVLTKERFNTYGSEIIILKLEDEFVEMHREDFLALYPWKVAMGDVDGDGKDEISVGVYKKTPLHQVMAKRPFVYYFEDNRLLPKWRGSRLSKPFTDYNFCDVDKDGIDELISIEELQNGEKIVNTYKWKGFGFEGFVDSKGFYDIKDLIIEDNNAYVTVVEDIDILSKEENYNGIVELHGETLIIERVRDK